MPLDHGADEAVHEEGTRSKRVLKKPNEPPLLEGHTSGSGEGSMEHTFELMDTVPPTPYNSPLTGGYTPRSDEDRLKLKELMAMCIKLSKQVLDLEKEKDAQAVEILKLKQRVKKLERKRKSSILHPRRRIYKQVESSDDDLDEDDASKQGRKSDKTKSMFKDSDFDVLDDNMENVEGETVNTATTGVSDVSAPVTTAGVAISTSKPRIPLTTAATAFIDEDLTIAQTLVKMRSEKAKEKGVAFRDVEETPRLPRSTTTLQPLPTIDPKDKGKGCTVEEEPENKKNESKRRMKEQKRINDFKPMDSEEDGSNTKKAGKRIKRIADSTSKQKSPKKSKVIKEQESAKSNEEVAADYEQEKEELRMWLAVVPDEDETVDLDIWSVKYPIVNWESQNLGSVYMEDILIYKIIRADGNTSYHTTFSSMLRKFDRQDLMDLHRSVMKRFEDNTLEGYNLLLWGDLKKRSPLIKEMLKKMLNRKLEAEAESTMEFKPLKFIKSRVE
ncbi:hypothetical protein Tco_0868310 [Tanacetum coccineum]